MQHHDARIASRFLSLRRQRPVRRRALRVLPGQPRLGLPTTGASTSTSSQHVPAPDGSNAIDVSHAPDRHVVRATLEGPSTHAAQRGQRRPRDQAGLRPAADRRLSIPRRALGQSRSAEAPGTAAHPRTRARLLRLHRSGHGDHLPGAQHVLRLRGSVAARDRQGAARDLLRLDRRRVHVRQRPAGEALDAGAPRVDPRQPQLRRRRAQAHPRPPHRRRGSRALPRDALRRPEALLARRRRELHRVDRRGRAALRQPGRAGDRHRHGPPRPPEPAGQRARQDAVGTVRRVRGQARRRPAVGRRQVPQGLLERRVHARRPGAPVAGVQPVPPRDRQPGRGRLVQGTDGTSRRPRRQPGAPDPGPRRRRLRRAGRGDGDAQPRADARLRHARHDPHRHQQPDRLHHVGPARLALHAVLHRRGQDDRGAGAARERRRPRCGHPRHADRVRLPDQVQARRRDRHRVLPQARPQRAGHAGADAADDVPEDRAASRHAQALRRPAGRAGRDDRGRHRAVRHRLPQRRWTPAS